MDTESAHEGLSRDQFGYAYFKDHHQSLGLAAPQPGGILEAWVDGGEAPQPTGKRRTVPADEALIPNQTHVHVDKVAEYVEKPSRKPIGLYKHPETGETHVLDGHHRLVAARVAGRSVRGEYWQ